MNLDSKKLPQDIYLVPMSWLDASPEDNVRGRGEYVVNPADPKDAQMLASIKHVGLLTPIPVTKDGDKLKMVEGYRRKAHIKYLFDRDELPKEIRGVQYINDEGELQIKVMVRKGTFLEDKFLLRREQIAYNVSKELSEVDLALHFLEEHTRGFRNKQIAKMYGRKEAVVSMYITVANSSFLVQILSEDKIGMTLAYEIYKGAGKCGITIQDLYTRATNVLGDSFTIASLKNFIDEYVNTEEEDEDGLLTHLLDDDNEGEYGGLDQDGEGEDEEETLNFQDETGQENPDPEPAPRYNVNENLVKLSELMDERHPNTDMADVVEAICYGIKNKKSFESIYEEIQEILTNKVVA